MEKQVSKEIYDFLRYSDEERWISYWHQLTEIIKLSPESVLEIGKGDGITGGYLKNKLGIKYACVDVDEDLKPDVVADINKLPFADGTYDIACAFEVLEHLPFEKFKASLKEMRRVSRQYVIISLPHWGHHFSIGLWLPYFKKIRWQKKFSWFAPKHVFNGQHYWEMDKKDYPLSLIKDEIRSAGFKIENDFLAFNSPCHHFFILKKI